MDDYLRNMTPKVAARNKAHLEPKVAETLRGRKGRPEAELQDEIISHLQGLGYVCAHFRPARVMRGGKEMYETPVAAEGKGFPDIMAVRLGTALAIEVKSEEGVLREEQVMWLSAWGSVPGVTAMVIRPSSWRDVKRWLR
jgi:hypothetical protein